MQDKLFSSSFLSSLNKGNFKKILLFGMSPMPFENDKKVYGTGIRTWQFLLPLLKNGHKICVCNFAIPSAYNENFQTQFIKDYVFKENEKESFVFDYNILRPDDFENLELLKKIFLDFIPDCVVGCSFYPSYIASKLLNYLKVKDSNAVCNFAINTTTSSTGQLADNNATSNAYNRIGNTVDDGVSGKVNNVNNNDNASTSSDAKSSKPTYSGANSSYITCPFWADLFGHVMAEAQARAFIDKSDECLFHYWNSEYNIITTADIFSTVSERQKYALIGELGAVGRLNQYTSGYEFAYCIPCGMPDKPFDVQKESQQNKNKDFTVLWSGGYNTWTDVDTLFLGLVKAMEKNNSIKFISTGGEIPEQDIKTYPRFLDMIKNSKFKDNFIMLGWIKGEEVPKYYFKADVGINIDKDIYEVRLGSKNRILDWFRAGLAVLSSNVCELTEIIEREKIGYTFRAHDADDLAQKLLYLAENKDELKKTAKRAQEYGFKYFNFNVTTKCLQNWVANPFFAPDYNKQKVINFSKEEALKNLQLITSSQKEMIEQKDRRIKELEEIVHKSFAYKIYGYLKILKRKILKEKKHAQ